MDIFLMSGNHEPKPNKYRYRLYREHKYIFYVFTELLRYMSSIDFSDNHSPIKLRDEVNNLKFLLHGHAEHEERKIHLILKKINSSVLQKAEAQHRDQDLFFEAFSEKFLFTESSNRMEDRHAKGYEIYLDFRKFFSENLDHFDYEERVILPELQKNVSDETLREVDRAAYRVMTAEQMVEMMEVLFQHMNCDDRLHFLQDIKDCQPQKFEIAWTGIAPSLSEVERNTLIKLLK